MIGNTNSSFFVRLGRKLFYRRLNREIFSSLMPHLGHESDEGYPFTSDEEITAQTEALDLERMLQDIEGKIKKLPAAYGRCFRYLMHKDIYERLQMYAQVAKCETPPATIDPRFVARPLVTPR